MHSLIIRKPSRGAGIWRDERAYGLDSDDAVYVAWNESVKATKRDLLDLLVYLKREGKKS